MKNETESAEKGAKKTTFLPPLLMSYFLAASFAPFFSVVIIDIASFFEVTVGIASQISLVYRSIGLVMGLVMGVLALRFNHKILFLFGIAMYGVGALGSGVAPNFEAIMAFQLFLGIGGAMITILIYTLIGELLPLAEKGPAVGLAWSSAFFANVFMPLITFIIVAAAGWQSVLIYFIFPFSILCLIINFFVIPPKPNKTYPSEQGSYSKIFKQILSNKSAIACMTGTMLVQVAYTFTVYVIAFYRLIFSMPFATSAVFATASGLMATAGTIIGGRLSTRVGGKNLTVMAGLFSGIFITLLTLIPHIWMSAAFWVGSLFLIAMTLTGHYTLTLEQIPEFRGTLMSLNQTFRYAGTVFGLIIGGVMLGFYPDNFQILIITYAASMFIMAAIVFAFTKDMYPKKK
jgi:predicted MFS family arabinose efflux permease